MRSLWIQRDRLFDVTLGVEGLDATLVQRVRASDEADAERRALRRIRRYVRRHGELDGNHILALVVLRAEEIS